MSGVEGWIPGCELRQAGPLGIYQLSALSCQFGALGELPADSYEL